MLEKVIVRFPGDNDFITVMFEIGNILLRFEKYNNRHHEDDFTKQEVAEFFNGAATPIYKLFRGKETYPIGNYLTIKEKDIYINEEVDEILKTYSQWGNGDSVLIDYWHGTVEVL